MARTNQRALPVALFAIAAALLAARVILPLARREPPATGSIRWLTIEQGLLAAQTSNRPVLLDFTADWCDPCHRLDAEVFANPEVARAINESFIAIRVVDRKREEGRNAPDVDALQQRFAVRGFPTVVFTDRSGERARMEGFRGREEFERVMESAR